METPYTGPERRLCPRNAESINLSDVKPIVGRLLRNDERISTAKFTERNMAKLIEEVIEEVIESTLHEPPEQQIKLHSESKKPLSPEAEQMLEKAVERIDDLCAGNQLAKILQSQSPEKRKQLWKQAANQFAPFADKIRNLRKALETADSIEKSYPPQLIAVLHVHLGDLKDELASRLLRDLFVARISQSPSHLYNDTNMPMNEAQLMALELDLSDGPQGEMIKNLNLDTIVKAILTGDLRVTSLRQLID